MSAWETKGMAEALPDVPESNAGQTKLNPQEHGWAPKQKFNYEDYNKSNKELADQFAAQKTAGEGNDDFVAPGESASGFQETSGAVGGLQQGDWSSNAAVYEWNDEYGEVGPAFPELEKQLFGSDLHVKQGINFSK
jgi:ATP-dependent RNA helicase DDX3X